MKHTSQNYDLTVGNVARWRNSDVSKFTARQTKLWFEMRDSAAHQTYSDDFNVYEWVWMWLDRFIFWPMIIVGAICLTFVLSSFLSTILSGRIEQILQSIGGR